MSDDTRGFLPPEDADEQQRSRRDDGASRRPLAGRYEVLEEIGSGATAITCRGRDLRLNRYVAIKIMRRDRELDPSFVTRFEREARTAASVSHGNVVDVYDVGQEDGDLYIVMQYIDGEDLKHLIRRLGALPVARAHEITRQVLGGVGAIHAAGIVHRDIKPQNVLIGQDGIARVTDFGIAQVAMDVGLTTAGTTVGTAAYMAPEQAQGGKLTEATDLYAVGVMLYEMLTGVMPFEASTPMGMMLAHIQQRPVSPSERAGVRSIPAHLDEIVLQAMAKDPVDRFRTAAAMSRALEGVSGTSSRTTILPGARDDQRTRTIGDAGSWPGESRAATADRPVRIATNDVGGAGGGMRVALGGFLLLLLLAIAGVGGYFVYGMVAEGSGEDQASEERTAPPTEVAPTATSTTASTENAEVPTEVPALVSTEVPTRTPTPVPPPDPTAVPTEIPRAAPTDAPTAAPTEEPAIAPTNEPADLPTDVPIEPQPTAESPIIEPVDGQEEPAEDDGDEGDDGDPQGDASQPISGTSGRSGAPGTSGNGQQVSGTNAARNRAAGSGQGGEAAAGQPTTLGIESKRWKGDGSKHDNDQQWVVVVPGGSATASFDIASLPAGESFAIEIELAVTGAGQTPLTVVLNGQELGRSDEALPVLPEGGTASDLGTLQITLPTAPLEVGKNEITIVNGVDGGSSEGDDDDDESDDDGDENGAGTSGNQGRGDNQDSGLPDDTLLLAATVITIDLAG